MSRADEIGRSMADMEERIEQAPDLTMLVVTKSDELFVFDAVTIAGVYGGDGSTDRLVIDEIASLALVQGDTLLARHTFA
jgi:hypothetical protein